MCTGAEHALVRRALNHIGPKVATGPDGVPGWVLKHCEGQLTAMFTSLFSISLEQTTVPTYLRTATINPVPKQTAVRSQNDYHMF